MERVADVDALAQYEACTRGIRVRAQSEYVPERSRPDRGVWLFGYRIQIVNEGVETVQLLGRHWIIVDAAGRREEVRGSGVVGEQPVLEPGAEFTYTSQCPLPTPCGSMQGTYLMVTANGERFEAEIPHFELIQANAIN